MKKLVFPSIRCRMGEWIYYVTCMTLEDVGQWVKRTDEVYRSKRLSEWIQRQLDEKHAKRISNYLRTEPERLFNSIVVGLYGAQPTWSELVISDPRDELSDEQEDYLARTIGLLTLTGREKLFAIDGQHRVAGIKQALELAPERGTDELSVLLVGHKDDDEGRRRTRKLFTTLNKTAKKVTPADIVALDEDNGLAVVTRRLVEDFPLFRNGDLIAFSGTAALNENDSQAITGIITLYEIIKALYPRREEGLLPKSRVVRTRPNDTQLNEIFDRSAKYWKLLCRHVPEYTTVLRRRTKLPGDYRTAKKNHLLFRPIGQMAFAGAVRTMMDRGSSMTAAVEALAQTELRLHTDRWRYILWDPASGMLRHRLAAEAILLAQVGQEPKSDAAIKSVREFLTALDESNPLDRPRTDWLPSSAEVSSRPPAPRGRRSGRQ